MTAMKSQFLIIVIVVFLMNIVNFLDRGIIPGASEEFVQFITSNGFNQNQDVYLGMLQSSFIVGYAIASIIFGHLCHHYPPFYLCIYGMIIWIAAVSFSGLAYYTNSYTFLFVTRMVSGVGEAAFQTSIPPWISKYAPPSHRGACLSLFFTAMPCGTALGYAYSAIIATNYGWEYCFFIEAILMSLFIPYLLYIAPDYPCESSENSSVIIHNAPHIHDSRDNSPNEIGTVNTPRSSRSLSVTLEDTRLHHKPTIREELKVLLTNPLYLCIVSGYAAQTGSLGGLTTFGSSFLIALGFFETETESSSMFGLIVSIAGVLATPLGGFLADWVTSTRQKLFEKKLDGGSRLSKKVLEIIELQTNLGVISYVNTMGAILLCLAYFIHRKIFFLIDLFLGAFFILLSSTSINVAVMMSVPQKHRAFAFGMSNLGLHLFGDVPSPIFAGFLKGKLAPHCSSQSASSAQCRRDNHGLRLSMLIMSSMTFVCVMYMFIAFLLSISLLNTAVDTEGSGYRETKTFNDSPSSSGGQKQLNNNINLNNNSSPISLGNAGGGRKILISSYDNNTHSNNSSRNISMTKNNNMNEDEEHSFGPEGEDEEHSLISKRTNTNSNNNNNNNISRSPVNNITGVLRKSPSKAKLIN